MSKLGRFSFAFVLVWVVLGGGLFRVLPAAAANEWYAEYFNNMTLSGGPVLTRYEKDLTHEWGTGSPGDGVPADGFSARFSRDVWFEAGTYRFTYRSDDGLRIWINDVLVVDSWQDQAATWHFIDHFVPGGVNRVRIEYYEHWGNAAMQLGWEKLQGGATWSATYWNNKNLAGSAALTRRDAAIDFDWGTGSPDPAVDADNFSARWARTLGFETGTYRFYASSDDGVRIYVDGQLILDAWRKQKLPNTHYADIALTGGNHVVVIDYFEEGGEAAIHVWWNRVDAIRGWQGRYYDNRELRGGPAMIRDDAEINFDWGEGAPTSWMPADNFSVRWVRTFDLRPGLYRFNAISDDGVRLWIDDVDLRLNHWEPQERTWHYQDWHYLEGRHTLRVEYFEKTGSASIQFWWDYAPTVEVARAMPPSPTYGATAIPTVPATSKPTTPTPSVERPGPWTAEYFQGRDISGTPVLKRTDPTIDFNWGWDSPSSEIPVNDFAVRWTGTFRFESGRYRFTTTTDDGVRLYVDDRLVLSSWRPMRGTRYATVSLTEGPHTVRMEYFEATQAARAQLSWQRLGQ
ncbi:MAG: PA14 domain-containing protein [Anaerolineae bacterium]